MILVLPSYERAFKSLTGQEQQRVRETVSRLEEAFAAPHAHTGLGIRKFGKFFETRAGLDLRILFVSRGDLMLVTVGDHGDVRAFVKDNPRPKV